MAKENPLEKYYTMTNIAEDLDDNLLNEIGEKVHEGYDVDCESRSDWLKQNEKGLKLARQLRAGEKTWAGETVSDVMYPMIATSAIQFASRAMPNIVKGADVVKAKVIGLDESGQKQERGDRIAKHMSWQLTDENEEWVDDTDQLLTTLPVTGVMFKKTFYDPSQNKNRSELIFPDNLIVNNDAKSLATAPRVTHIIELKPNDIIERVREGVFLDKEFGEAEGDQKDEDRPHKFLEQHTFYDLDGDGYKEPYIITVHKETKTVVRITARYDLEGIEYNQKKEVAKIRPVQYFTRYPFLRAFDGSFYCLGFGALLGPLNETVNTTLNQLIDSGTTYNRQGGFLATGIRLGSGGTVRVKMNEWTPVPMTGDDIRKGMVPFPAHEPSTVLFRLLEYMVEMAKELSSTADVLTGEQPATNVPATTTLAMIEQGLKVFTAIYLRIHRALSSELRKLRRLNYLYLPDEIYQIVLDDPEATAEDYNAIDYDIVPVSDTADLTDIQRMAKARALMELKGQGLNDMEIMRRYLEALNIPNIDDLIPTEEPPNMKLELEKRELDQKDRELEQRDRELDIEEAAGRAKIDKYESDAAKNLSEIEEGAMQIDELKAMLDKLTSDLEIKDRAIEILKQKGENNGNIEGSIPGMEEPPNNTGGYGGSPPIEGNNGGGIDIGANPQ